MRIHQVLLLNQTAAFVAGSLIAVTICFVSSAIVSVFVAIALIIGVAIFAWRSYRRLIGGLSQLQQLILNFDGNRAQSVKSTGLLEFDDLAVDLLNRLKDLSQQAKVDQEETQQLERLIAQIDRRGNVDLDAQGVDAADHLRQLLHGYADSLTTDFGQFTTCGREIQRCADQIAQNAENQSHTVNQSAQLVEQISEQIDAVMENAKAACESAESTREISIHGMQQVDDLLTDLRQVETLIASRGKRLRALGENTLEISGIVETIGQISSRTDLLALNASIESVRAGQHGRGFAVVAEEVRGLAEQSAMAARDAALRIETIQSETQQSAAVIQDEHAQIQNALKRLANAKEVLEKISHSSGTTATCAQSMTKDSRQQFKVAEQFVDAVQSLSENVRSGRSQIEGIRWTTKSFEKLAKQFHQRLNPFRASPASPTPDSNEPVYEEERRELTDQMDVALSHTDSLLSAAD